MSKYGFSVQYGDIIECKFKYSKGCHTSVQNKDRESRILTIDLSPENHIDVAQLQAEAEIPQSWAGSKISKHVMDARQLLTRPAPGKAHTLGHHSLTTALLENQEVRILLDSGAACLVVGRTFLEKLFPEWRMKLLPCSNMTFKSCNNRLEAIGIIELPLIFPHIQGSVRIKPEFVVMEDATPEYFILGSDFFGLYGIDIVHSREKYFTIGNDNKKKKFALCKSRDILPIENNKADVGEMKQNETITPINDTQKVNEAIKKLIIGPKLTEKQRCDLETLVKNIQTHLP
ncbi:hypothetical protein CROQUDRAFT_45308 [Cronartium quercuum f. sp. fusiforme G11]|uniref:Uncharacterized protein n=1 Tax=Cronartium quercuum f. sp. fusiforme G11 TaxID=708437 RepID=A0A9P6NLP4_9BASI|nr:hypothetical protein CROQUDRAFT_45308 [Cronartium quercuum f. sp. fusiforme G11]